ncbi:YdcH family protein [Methylobacterium sp. ID0610]|uniref:YdcH family protein n=1 Tax=Methylobacterium carpenticola TaxID=3344827 RepID=UPI0036B06541
MSLQTHLSELERKHEALEREIQDAISHPSTDDLRVVELKRRKLHLKDEINRLRTSVTRVIH